MVARAAAGFTPASTFQGIRQQVDRILDLGKRPKDPTLIPDSPDSIWKDAFVQARVEKATKTENARRLSVYHKDLTAYINQKDTNQPKLDQLFHATVKLLGSHIAEQPEYPDDREKACVQSLKTKLDQYRIRIIANPLTDEQFNTDLKRYADRTQEVKDAVDGLYQQLYAAANADALAADPAFIDNWNKIPEDLELAEKSLNDLRNNEAEALIALVNTPNANQYTSKRWAAANRIQRINQVAQVLQDMRANHRGNKSKPVAAQIREAHSQKHSYYFYKTLSEARNFSPDFALKSGAAVLGYGKTAGGAVLAVVKFPLNLVAVPIRTLWAFPENHPNITTAVAIGALGYAASYFEVPYAGPAFTMLKDPATYGSIIKGVYNFGQAVWTSAWQNATASS